MMNKPERLVVLVTGATGIAGRATCSELAAAGHRVIAASRDGDSLAALSADGVEPKPVDLTDAAAVVTLAASVRRQYGTIDGLVHLVGGWRGGNSFTANTDEDWAFLSSNLIDTLRHTTQAVHDDLVSSSCGRAVIVSATAAAKPAAGNANYATAKAAAEAWMQALADSLRRNQSGRKADPAPQTSAAVILVIKAIGDAAGFTSAEALADSITGLFDADAGALNGARIDLTDAR
ncbi:MAG: SDR family NAD(P)-dependent oxidoreductase [Actinomycetota bacterium]|nr:SDR family NAD(P)-dependent oxidoreductase [Actinomycetota bacterium]